MIENVKLRRANYIVALIGLISAWASYRELFSKGVAVIFALVLSILISAIIEIKLINHEYNLAIAIMDVVILMASMIFGMESSVVNVIGLIVAFVGFLTIKNTRVAIQTMVAVFAVCLVVIIIFPEQEFKQWGIFTYVRDKVTACFEDKEILQEYGMTSGGVNGGEIGDVDEITYSYKTMLRLRTGFVGSVYLRGFAGVTFENNKWRDLKDTEYGYSAEVFKDASIQTGLLFSTIDSSTENLQLVKSDATSYLANVFKRKFTVVYEGQSTDFAYVPYESMYAVQSKSSYDGYYLNNKDVISSYGYEVNDVDYDFWKTIVDSYTGENTRLKQYISWEKSYREAVYNLYTNVSDDKKAIIDNAKAEVPEYNPDGSMKGILDYTQNLKNYFEQNFTYTLAPGRVPEGMDAFEYFMDENPKGFCTYFATAATFVLRNAGIPCRYVEGYTTIVSDENAYERTQVSDSRNSNAFSATDSYMEYSVNITDANAHAWVEIYMDGYGWIPVDVTPGFSEVMADNSSQIEIIENDNSAFEYDEDYYDPNVEQHVKDSYDTWEEYMHDNTTKVIDFKIALPILGRFLWGHLKNLLIILLCMLIIMLGFIIPERVSKCKRKWLYNYNKCNSNEENATQIMSIFAMLEKLGRFLKAGRRPEETYAEYGERLIHLKYYFEKADVNAIIGLVRKSKFSDEKLSEDEIKKACASMMLINEESYNHLGKFKRLIYKYIWHLG